MNGNRVEGIRTWRKHRWLGVIRKLKFRPRSGLKSLLAKLSTATLKKKEIQWQRIRQPRENFISELRQLNNNYKSLFVFMLFVIYIASCLLGSQSRVLLSHPASYPSTTTAASAMSPKGFLSTTRLLLKWGSAVFHGLSQWLPDYSIISEWFPLINEKILQMS